MAAGEPLAEVHARDERSADEAVAAIEAAYAIADQAPLARPLLLEVLSA